MMFDRQRVDEADRIAGGLRRREADAVARLYDLMGGKLYSVILAIVRNPITAEDLVQDTFIRVWNRSDQFSGESETLGRWLFAIGRNKAIDHIRASRRRPEQGAIPIEGDEHTPRTLGTASKTVGKEEAHDIREAISRLSPRHREVIRLAYYEGLSQVEIALRLEQPLGTVKAWARTALKHLRESMDGGSGNIPMHSGSPEETIRRAGKQDFKQ